MATGTPTNVSTGKPNTTAAIYYAPLATTLPNDATTAIDTTKYTKLGYASEDGVTNTNSPESDKIKAWGGDTVLTMQTEKSDEWGVTLIESLNVDVLKVVYGTSNVSGTLATGISISANSSEPTEYVWVFDMVMRGGALKRIVLPDAKISEIGEIVYKDDELVGYELTLEAMPDASGNTHYEYIEKS